MHVMRVHIADLKLWSANDRRTGGKAVPIKEHCSDTAYQDDLAFLCITFHECTPLTQTSAGTRNHDLRSACMPLTFSAD